MNKVKMFFIAAALVLVTAGVFAAKAKFAVVGVYALTGGGFVNLDNGSAFTDLTTSSTGSTQPAYIVSSRNSSISYPIYQYDNSGAGTYSPLYTTF